MLRPALLFLIALSAFAQTPQDWIQLFNGKNLDGWTPKITGYALGDNFGDTFRVEDGVLKVAYDKYDKFNNRFGHLFYKDKFSYYRLVVEYRFTGEQCPGGPGWALRNSGAMLHGQAPNTMGKDQDFPISIEVQLLGGSGTGTRTTANLCTPGTNVVMNDKLFTTHCVNSKSRTYHGEQWVRVEMEVHGSGNVKHIIDGETVLAYEMPQIGGGNVSNHDPKAKPDGTLIEGGWISLQSESHPVEFRKVELLNLAGCMDNKAANYKPWFIKSEPSTCRYAQ
jgi:3-keto-disaccharide hydrolase